MEETQDKPSNWIGELGDDVHRFAQHFANTISVLFRVPAKFDLEMWASNDSENPVTGSPGVIQLTVKFDDTETDIGGSE